MPSFLRIIQRGRWARYPTIPWLSPGEIKADALRDLQTRQDALSIYRADDEADANKICVAIAATRENLGHVDYAVFDGTELLSIGIEPAQTAGETPDPEVNRLHCDLTTLTVEKVGRLTQIIAAGAHNRISKKSIETSLRSALRSNSLDRNGINSRLLRRLENG